MSDLQTSPRIRSSKRTKRFSAAALVGVLLVTGVMVSVDQAANSSGKIRAFCVNKNTEKVAFRKTCKANEKRFSYAKSGKSAYQTWLDLGNSGTEQDFINSLKGSNGSAARSFAITCYQKLKEAESAGYIWRDQVDLARFERMTGCEIETIDMNPFANLSQSPLVQVLSADLVGFYGGAGSGSEPNYEYGTLGAMYEVLVRNETSLELCGTQNTDVLDSPVSGKTYILGSLDFSTLQSVLSLRYGLGRAIDAETTEEREVQVGDFTLHFSRWVTSVPSKSESMLVLEEITYGQEQTPIDASELTIEIGFPYSSKAVRTGPSEVLELPFELSFETTESIGQQLIHFYIGGAGGEYRATESIFVGVEYCDDGRGPYLENHLLSEQVTFDEGITPFQYLVNVPNIVFEGNGLGNKTSYLMSEGFERYVNALGY